MTAAGAASVAPSTSSPWPVVQLGEVLTHRKEFIRLDDSREYRRCRVQLHAKGIVLRDRVEGALIKTKDQQVCRAGEFLVAEIDAKVGGFGVVPPELDGAIVSSHYFLFAIDFARLDQRFLAYYSKTPAFRDQVCAQGSTNYAAIRPSHVLGYTIPLPPLPEQRRILAKLDRTVARQQEARALAAARTQRIFAFVHAAARAVLARVDSPTTELRQWLDPSREGIQTGPFGAQLGRGAFTESGTPVLTIGNVQYGGLDTANVRFVAAEKASQLERYRILEGDVLFARMGTVGRCCVVPAKASGWLINYHIIRVALDHARVLPRFLHWTLRASSDVERYLDATIRGATREGVNSRIVGGLPCRIPDLTTQRRLLMHLDGLETMVNSLKTLGVQGLAELDALMPAILDRAFRGEL